MIKTSSARTLRSLTRTILFFAIACAAVPALARSYRVADFSSTIHVDKDGSARVTEKISVAFNGQFQGIYRDIPVDYPGPRGSNYSTYSLFVKITQITDETGSPLKYEKRSKDGFLHLKIFVPDAVDATRTVNIEYSVPNATKFFEDHDEFYWNVTGNDWPVPIDAASVTVFFPPETSGSLRAQAYRGVYGSAEPARSSLDGPSATAEASNLPMRGGLTIDVYIPKDLLKEPGALTKAGWFLRSNPILTLPLWAFAVMFSLWWFKGRDPNPGESVAPMYEPPQGMGPAEVGTLIDGSVASRDITSVLVDLAVRGYIKIVETEHKGVLLSSKDYELHFVEGAVGLGRPDRLRTGHARPDFFRRPAIPHFRDAEPFLYRAADDEGRDHRSSQAKRHVHRGSGVSPCLFVPRRFRGDLAFRCPAVVGRG